MCSVQGSTGSRVLLILAIFFSYVMVRQGYSLFCLKFIFHSSLLFFNIDSILFDVGGTYNICILSVYYFFIILLLIIKLIQNNNR